MGQGSRGLADKRKKRSGIVTLITDFGSGGEYSGAMKGAVLAVNPRCQVVDVTHEITPQNILQASWVVKNVYPFYPPGTVHAVVVDPGVGTSRRAIVLHHEGHFFVGPDNGVFTSVLSKGEQVSAYQIAKTKFFRHPVSDTFHGRDIFAPVAGHLSAGLEPERLGPKIKDLVRLDWPAPKRGKGDLKGKVLWADSFGNLITNISREEYGPELEERRLRIGGRGWRIERLNRTYGESRPGDPLALFGSGGLLEISLNGGNARDNLGLKPGDSISIQLL